MDREAPKTPLWSAGPQRNALSVATREALNTAAKKPSTQQVAGDNAPLRVIYGDPLVQAQLVTVVPYLAGLLFLVCWGYGEIDSIQTLYINDEAAPGGIVATHYVGNQTQNPDPSLVAAFAARSQVYADNLRGIAYSSIYVPAGAVSGFPRFSAKIRGLKVTNYRWQVLDETTADTYLDVFHGRVVRRERNGTDGWESVKAKYPKTTGKWYYEFVIHIPSGIANQYTIGLAGPTDINAVPPGYVGVTADSWGYYPINGQIYNNNTPIQSSLTTSGNNDVIGVAWDADAGTCSWYKNNVLIVTRTGITGNLRPAAALYEGDTGTSFADTGVFNFRPSELVYSPPTGFQCWYGDNVVAWTSNPADHLADFLKNARYGCKRTISGIWAAENAEHQSEGVRYVRDALNGVGGYDSGSMPPFYSNPDGGLFTMAITTSTPHAGVGALRTTNCIGGHSNVIQFFKAFSTTATLRVRTRANAVATVWGGSPVNGLTCYYALQVYDLATQVQMGQLAVAAGADSSSWVERTLSLTNLVPGRSYQINLFQNANTGNIGVDYDSMVVETDCPDPAEPRRLSQLVIDNPQTIEIWKEALRTYAGCFLIEAGNGEVIQFPDRPASSTFALTKMNSRVRGMSLRNRRNAPTVLRVAYTDDSELPPRTRYAYVYASGVQAGTTPYRESQVALPGITRRSQATREALERLNKLYLQDLRSSVSLTDEGLALVPGQVGTYSNLLGLSNKPVRVVQISHDQKAGDYSVELEEYDPAAYSNFVESTPTFQDTSLPSPLSPPTVTGLSATEELYQLQAYGQYASRLRVTWTRPSWPFLVDYLVEVFDDDLTPKLVDSKVVTDEDYASPALEEGVVFTIKVYARSRVAASATPGQTTKTLLGKQLPPGDVPSFTAFESGGDVFMEWEEAIDIDIQGYEIRYRPIGSGSWKSGDVGIILIDATKYIDKGSIPAGDWTLMIKAIDSVGNESINPTEVDVTVTLDTNAFIAANQEFGAPTLTNVSAEVNRVLNSTKWVTNRGELIAFGQSNPTNSAQGWDTLLTTPFLQPANTGVATFLSGTVDLGLPITGTFRATINVTVLTGSVVEQLELSLDNTTWTIFPTGAAKTTARYARYRVEGPSNSVFTVEEAPRLLVDAIAKEETFQITTLASGGKLVQLSNAYSLAKSIQTTPIASTNVSAAPDRILLTPAQASGALCHEVQFLESGAGRWAFRTIKQPVGYVVASGDKIRFDVWIDPRNPTIPGCGGVEIIYTDASSMRASGINDTDGRDISSPAFTTANAGQWITRTINIPAGYNGKTMDYFAVCFYDSTSGALANQGVYRQAFRNIRILNSADVLQHTIYSSSGGEPSANAALYEADVVAGTHQCGPSNSFLVRAFNSGGQVAADTFCSFKGI
jgi:hypothetical protein